jgi:hypothetical protein
LQGGGATCHLETVSFADPTVEPPAGVTFPDGLVDFVATNCSRGSTVKLTLILSAPVPPTARFWRYGRTVADRSPHWDAMPSSIDANTVTYRITDGGSGDNDLSVNGTISARLGLGLGAVATPLAPGGLTASPGNGTVDLRWNPAPSATGYTIKRATTRDGPYVSVSTNQPGNVF